MTHVELCAEQCKLKVSASSPLQQEITYLERMYFQMYFPMS
jgi:hypothetical protein